MSTEILPIDVIDHILSFLRSDIISLKACAKSHPILTDLSERYIYADVTLRSEFYETPTGTTTEFLTIEFTQILAEKPDIADHVRSLKVFCVSGRRRSKQHELTSFHLEGVASLLPMLAGLTKFTIHGNLHSNIGFPWDAIPETLRQAFLHHLRLRDIVIHNIHFFPMESLNDRRDVRLSLEHCGRVQCAYDGKSTISTNAVESYPAPLEHLSISYCSDKFLEHIAAWVNSHGLRSLKYAALVPSSYLGQLFVACSNSLTSLQLDTSKTGNIATPYEISNGCAIHSETVYRFPFTLAGLPHLTQLQVTLGPWYYSDEDWTLCSPMPAIADLVSTAPPTVQQMSIEFHFIFTGWEFESLPDPAFIWCPLVILASVCSLASISLYISPYFLIRDSIAELPRGFFSPLADYKGLTPYVQSGVVVISEDYLKQ